MKNILNLSLCILQKQNIYLQIFFCEITAQKLKKEYSIQQPVVVVWKVF